jgi:LacI family gluconate utilization system Gnt-I transcriptional repressor
MEEETKRRGRRRLGTASVTMADVAQVAGVSAQTVSRVLRDPAGCTPETRARVEAAVRSTRYVQNLAASHLASNRSMTVAAVIPQIAASVFAETVQGLSNVLLQAGYQVIIGHTDYSHEREENVVRSLLGRRPDAFFLVGTRHTDAVREMLQRAAIPVVETWAWTRKPIDQLVGFSNHEAIAAAVAYVQRRGYARPVFVAAARPGDDRARERLEGYVSGMARHYAGQPARTVVMEDLPYTMGSGRMLLDAARTQFPDSDVLLFSSDLLASGALLACQRQGIEVPRQLAIVGFGDYEVGRELNPGLTTIAVPTVRMGEEAARMLVQRLRGEPVAARRRDLGFELIERGSA